MIAILRNTLADKISGDDKAMVDKALDALHGLLVEQAHPTRDYDRVAVYTNGSNSISMVPIDPEAPSEIGLVREVMPRTRRSGRSLRTYMGFHVVVGGRTSGLSILRLPADCSTACSAEAARDRVNPICNTHIRLSVRKEQ